MQAFVGVAGTGKTYRLINEALCLSKENHASWTPRAAVLALSFMHGARARLNGRLRTMFQPEHVPFQCQTLDSLALRIVRFARTYLGIERLINVDNGSQAGWRTGKRGVSANFDTIRRNAASLLSNQAVRACFRSSYPLVMIDEFQDCDGQLLAVVKALAETSDLLLAADAFQYLSEERHCPAVDWLLEHADVTHLKQPRRVRRGPVLAAARSLRSGNPEVKSSVLKPIHGGGLAAWEIMFHVLKKGWSYPVIISPISPEKSPFVSQTLRSLSKELGKKMKMGPLPFTWLSSRAVEDDSLVDQVLRGKATLRLEALDQLRRSNSGRAQAICDYVVGLLKLRGLDTIDELEFKTLALRYLKGSAAYRASRISPFSAMTVHGAKNNEFPSVFVLWPHGVYGDDLYRRKLLYNAVTRSQGNLLVLSEGGEPRAEDDAALSLLVP